jgi:hypothetical protein
MTLFLPPLNLRLVARTTLQELVCENTTDPKLLDQIARIYCEDSILMKGVIRHPQITRDTLSFLTESGPPDVQLIARTRLGGLPAVRDTLATVGHSDPKATPPSGKGKSDADETVYQMIQQMTVSEKVRYAMKADKPGRSLLLKDPNKQIALAVVESPKITEQEVESIAQSRNVSEDVIRAIAKKRDWLKNYAIVQALVNNPKTPVGIATTLLPQLKNRDLNLLAKNRGVSEAVRSQAAKFLKNRSKT